MKISTKCLGLAAMVVLYSPTMSANSISVETGAGLGGTTYALKCTPDGGTDKAFVESDHPTAETTFSAEFRILAETDFRNDFDLNRVMEIAVAFGNNVPSRNLVFGVQRAANNPNNFRLWAYARNNDTGKLFPYVVFNFTPDTDTLVKVEWQAASGPSTDDGIIRIYKNGNLISQRTDIPGYGHDIERIRFGLPTGSPNTGTTGAGSLYIDEVVLLRTITP